ncbi:MAG: methyltransferase domain-containing protein [Acidobacteriia bacterium]|nr:methyltransferase domain-containing protein [Terriglobia bacterium]
MVETKSPRIPFTGERFVPGEGGARIAYEHLHRYWLARQVASGMKVLDLGCGEGYGSAGLAEVAQSVLGLDLSAEAIEHARKVYPRPNLHYEVGDCRHTPCADGEFDLVVCFELIEHVNDQEQLLHEVKRVLGPRGVLVVSSPDKKFYSDEPRYENPFHAKELYLDEFKALLERHFEEVIIFGQKGCVGSLLIQEGRDNSGQDGQVGFVEVENREGFFKVRDGAPGYGSKYAIAVCSKAPVQAPLKRFMAGIWNDASESLLQEVEAHNTWLKSQIEGLNTQIGHLLKEMSQFQDWQKWAQGELGNREQELTRIKDVLAQEGRILQERDLLIQTHIAQLQELKDTVHILKRFEESVKGSFFWRFYRRLIRSF